MPPRGPALYRALHQAMRADLVRACHDLSEGGLAVAAAEMCIAGRLGLELTLHAEDPTVTLFSESNGRFLIEVRPANCESFEAHFGGLLETQVRRIGLVASAPRLSVTNRGRLLFSLPVSDLVVAWNRTPGGL